MTRRFRGIRACVARGVTVLLVGGAPWLLGGCAGTPQIQTTNNTVAPPTPTIESSIQEASERFNVPIQWIRAVMQQESGGRTTVHGKPIVSPKGAMGLMQLMPLTWAALRNTYHLGSDPFDPHDNIIAGTAYIREMYDQYGSPAFLAAYNAGPGRYETFLRTHQPLPGETRHYVAVIAPKIDGIIPDGPVPVRQSPSATVLTALPTTGGGAPVVVLANRPQQPSRIAPPPAPVQVAAVDIPVDVPTPKPPVRPTATVVAPASPDQAKSHARHGNLPPGWYVPVAYVK